MERALTRRKGSPACKLFPLLPANLHPSVPLIDLRAGLAPGLSRRRIEKLRRRLPEDAPEDWLDVAAIGALALGNRRVIGVCGGQGSGKSTLAALLARAMELEGRKTVACSLDDFYLTRAARKRLAATVHPLLATRGVPGTHDIDLARSTLASLAAGAPTRIPRFDKGLDDRAAEDSRAPVRGVRAVVFEGWCLGVTPQPEAMLARPVNELEASEDPDAGWRTYVNDACRRYEPLWSLVDWWIHLEVPDMACVRRWRRQQETRLPGNRRMSEPELERFLAHYERLTLWLKSPYPGRADWHLALDRQHRVRSARSLRAT